MNKKGQVEIIGLAVLVVLLVIILVVALRFSFNTDDTKDDIRSSLIANNLLNAIIKEKSKIDVKDLIYECYTGVKKGVSQEISCMKLTKELNKIITLSSGNKNFEFKLSTDSFEFFKEGKCSKGIQSSPYRFKKETITFVAMIKLC